MSLDVHLSSRQVTHEKHMAFCLKQVLDGDVTRTRNFYFVIETSYEASRIISITSIPIIFIWECITYVAEQHSYVYSKHQSGSVLLLRSSTLLWTSKKSYSFQALTVTTWKPLSRITDSTLFNDHRFLLTNTCHQVQVLKKKIKFTLEQAMRVQRWSREAALLFLQLRLYIRVGG